MSGDREGESSSPPILASLRQPPQSVHSQTNFGRFTGAQSLHIPTADRRLIPEILLLVLGILLILYNFGVIGAWSWASVYWLLLLTGVGVRWVVDPNSRGVGVAAIIVGSIFELSKLGILDLTINHLLRYWPLILVAVGLNILIRHRARGGWVGGVIVLTLGIIFQIQQLGWLNISVWRLWPIPTDRLGALHAPQSSRKAKTSPRDLRPLSFRQKDR